MPQISQSKVSHYGDGFSCLFIGPVNSGKSCLLKSINGAIESLHQPQPSAIDKEKLFSSIYPTVGTEITNVQLPARTLLAMPWTNRVRCYQQKVSSKESRNSKTPDIMPITLREVGGSLQPLWHRYYSGLNALCITIDGSSLLSPCGGSATSLATIADVLTNQNLKSLPVALVLTKVDGKDDDKSISENSLPSAVDVANVSDMVFSVKQFFMSRSQQPFYNVTVCTSAKTNAGIIDLAHWLAHVATVQ